MDLFIQTKAFNPSLIGQAVRIKGHDVDGEAYNRLFLVKDVEADHIKVVNSVGNVLEISMENFEIPDGLELIVLEAI
ncbi:hypothetical protein M3172_08960 [Mesobacillus subterraneus]|uniref:hypothetical protein n=1 Tax=Mesobacillus subterraneus TaxID=285983 RepID=UPI00203AFAC1|nr:hypothetical protein [Mesobacillus subterraneus]MCM3573324.1 hypothetical protein [Mesobacillus subterraneus]